MKTYKVVAAGLLIASATAVGQGKAQNASYFASIASHSEEYIQAATENYTLLLRSLNDGVVESAIAQLTYLRMGSPERDLTEAQSIIAKLAETGRTAAIRYKARLSLMVFDTPGLFAEGVDASPNEKDAFFLQISSKVQRTFLGSNL